MASIAHLSQVCHSISLPSPHFEREEVNLRSSVSFHLVGKTYKLASSKHIYDWCCQPIILRKGRGFKVSSFKGNSQNEQDGTDTRFRSPKKSVQLSLPQQESKKIANESTNSVKKAVSVACDDNESSISGSFAIRDLFEKWLMLLQRQGMSLADQNRRLEQSEGMNPNPEAHGKQTGKIFRAVSQHFWALNAAIKLPLLIFPPFYLVVRSIYGVEVARELMPLWILGPLIFVSYVLVIRGICALYVFCFKLCKTFMVNLPTYYGIICKGKIFQHRVFQPLIEFKNMDYKAFTVEKLKQLNEWFTEKRLDFVEAIWPYYCRTIRFLKRANLI